MSARDAAPAPVNPLERRQWRQFALITAGALAIYAGLRVLPTGTNLSHMDFRVDPKAGNAIEFCDPANPQFIPVVAARSPVTVNLTTREPAMVGSDVQATMALRTAGGKPVAPEDMLVTHTMPLHLLVVDPTLRDYQHVHPVPAKEPGNWKFAFTPRLSGTYRVFADFTPAATSRGLYASADLEVRPVAKAAGTSANTPTTMAASAGRKMTVEQGGYVFSLVTARQPVRAGETIDLQFAVLRPDGAAVPLQPVMGAFAHLVAFDEARTGFAHLHPAEADVLKAPDAKRPVLNFKLTIPSAGPYVVWAQVNLDGTEVFVPFALEVF